MEYFDSKITAYRAEMLQKAGYKDGFRDGEAEGIEKGIEKGIAQGKVEIAKAMLSDGMSVALVARYSGLTPEEVEALSRG